MSWKGILLKYLETAIVFLYFASLLWFTLINLIVGVDERWISTPFYRVTRHATCFIRFETPPFILLESVLLTTFAMRGYSFQYGVIFNGDDEIYCRAVVKYKKNTAMDFKHNLYWMYFVPWTIVFTMAWLENVGQFFTLLSMNASHADNITSACIFLLCILMIQIMLGSDVIALPVNGYRAMRNLYKQHFELETAGLNDNILEDIFAPD